jgi:hypothetical protein
MLGGTRCNSIGIFRFCGIASVQGHTETADAPAQAAPNQSPPCLPGSLPIVPHQQKAAHAGAFWRAFAH